MKLISGKTIAADIRETLRQRIESLKEAEKRLPKLSVILVGDDPASATYVRNKERACAQTGILSETIRMREDTTQQALLEVLFDGPEWQYERFIRENGLEEKWE